MSDVESSQGPEPEAEERASSSSVSVRVGEIEARVLSDRAAGYATLYDGLAAELEGNDGRIGRD